MCEIEGRNLIKIKGVARIDVDAQGDAERIGLQIGIIIVDYR